MAEFTKKRRKRKEQKPIRMNPISLANLEGHRFRKGEVSNPNGRPRKELSITESLREVSLMGISESPDKSKLTYAQAAALVHWQLAVKGDKEAYSFITNRLEGKPKESVDITTKGKALNEQPVIPTTVIDQAMAILYAAGASAEAAGDGLPAGA